ncbi:MAG: amidohydrolase family protein [Crocinitomicaceae bacterium]|nr:amidohydrolase family protein [Crocinitomicaceae bacterium]
MKLIISLIVIVALSWVSFGQSMDKILLIDGYLHVGNGEIMETAAIGIIEGKIAFVKNSNAYTIDQTEWDTIISVKGKQVYPGFIAPNSTLGLTEIDAVKATRDFDEVGTYNPHIRSQIAFNVESKVISTVRTNGVLLSQASPRGGSISGSSSIMKLLGWNWEDATVLKDDGIHLNWPSTFTGGGWWAEPAPKNTNKDYTSQKAKLYDFFEMSKSYAKTNENIKYDIRMEAMRACFKGDKRVYIHADELQQLVDIIDFAAHFDLSFPVIVGGYDSHHITRRLADAKIPVMVVRPHSLPENEEDDIDMSYKLPFLLQEGGVEFCIQNHGDMEAMNTRNIPFLAGTAMAYGLTEEQAISSISLSSAKILGIDKTHGSVEKGKSATLFVSEGNALDMRTNQVILGLVDGEFMPITNMQYELFQKYTEKYNE